MLRIPQVAEALALAASDPELAGWLAAQRARQQALREKFRQITPPPGLQEQIISEHAASQRRRAVRRTAWAAAAALLLLLGSLASVWFPHQTAENPLARYQHRMVRTALEGYAMDVLTNDVSVIRAHLALNHAPSDFNLTGPLQHNLTGCAVMDWQNAKVALVCFHTGKALPPGASNDLWLFVVDQTAVPGAPDSRSEDYQGQPAAPPLGRRAAGFICLGWKAGNRTSNNTCEPAQRRQQPALPCPVSPNDAPRRRRP